MDHDYSLFFAFFSELFIIHFKFFCDIHYSFIKFLYQFSFSNSLPVNYITKKVKTVTSLVTLFFYGWLPSLHITQRKRIVSQKRGRNLEIKQYMEFILSENFLQFYTLVIKSLHFSIHSTLFLASTFLFDYIEIIFRSFISGFATLFWISRVSRRFQCLRWAEKVKIISFVFR